MLSKFLRQCAASLTVAAAACANPAQAADASAWDGTTHSALRLIAGTQPRGEAFLHAGAEIRLAPGWKTYWRYPGDAGVPPRFDFSRSANVASVAVAWPAPQQFTDEGGTTIGYARDVVFPLRVIARDPKNPVTLRLTLDYAVCEKLCVPARAAAELALSARPASGTGPSAETDALTAAETRIPQPATVGQAGALSIRAVRRDGPWPKPRIVVDVAAPAGKPVDLFAEGPTPEWALPLPVPQAGAPDGVRRFVFTIDGEPPGVSAEGKTITLTAVSDGAALEVPFRLD